VKTQKTTDLDAVFKRQRGIQGICGKTQPDFSEQWIQQMSYSAEERVRTLLKAKSDPTGTKRSQEVPASDWLDSPNVTAEARLCQFDSEHPQTRNLPAKPRDSEILIQWKAASQSVALFEDSEVI